MSVIEQQWEMYAGRTEGGFSEPKGFLAGLTQQAVHVLDGEVLVTRHAEVATIHRDAARYASRAGLGSQADEIRASLSPGDRREFNELQEFRRYLMAREDGERHARLRSLAHRAFTPRRIASLQRGIERYMEELADDAEAQGALNISAMAYRLPLRMIGDLLAVPRQDHELLHAWSQDSAAASNTTGAYPHLVRAALAAIENFKAYSERLLEQWRENPGSSELVDALVAGDNANLVTAVELAGTFVQLIAAGQDTTSRLLSCGLYELLQRPEQWALLCAAPEERASNATEELLRFISPLAFQARVPQCEVTIGGHQVKAGTTVFPVLAAANRDPEVFENPDVLDILRPNARQHLAFGVGLHFCLGSNLARSEAYVAFSMLARRFPTMALTDTANGWMSRVGYPEPHDLMAAL